MNGHDQLEEMFSTVYNKFKLHFYQETFARFQNREASLTTVEAFAMEAIYALKCPTVREFARFMRISSRPAMGSWALVSGSVRFWPAMGGAPRRSRPFLL